MYREALRAAWAEIDLADLAHNVRQIRALTGPQTDVIGVIKADAYGHGSIKAAETLRENGIRSFAVATPEEGILLRENGITEDILVLGLTPSLYADTLVTYDLSPVVCDSANAAAISACAARQGKSVSGFIAVDTGMGRIGYLPEDAGAIADIRKISTLSHFTIRGLLSHFATADAADKTYAREQERRYTAFCERLQAEGFDFPVQTIANSAAIMELPSTHFDAVRAGIILYGCYPSPEVDKARLDLRPVMSVKADIIHLKRVPAGTTISYGQKFTAARDSLIATLGLGYADGYPRPYSHVGQVIVNGRLAPLAGNICMDQCMVDVTDVPDVKAGDQVIIMGSDGQHTISADDIARATGTINYEILCAFGQRLPKVYR